MQRLWQHTRSGTPSGPRAWSALIGPMGLAIAVGVAYFFAARLSLALLTKPDGVAVFWPAAGIAVGNTHCTGIQGASAGDAWSSWPQVALASLLGDRSIAAAIVFALCNVGEPLLVAWLIKHRFGHDFRLESLRQRARLFCGGGDRAGDLGKCGDGRLHPLLQLRGTTSDHLAELVRF